MGKNVNVDEKIVKCEIELERIFFPRGKSSVKSGEFAIFSADIVKPLENCDDLYGSWSANRIKLKGTVPQLDFCERYKLSCKLAESNDKYGDTYEIVYMSKIIDLSDKAKQRNFLMSVLNEKTVEQLYQTFDDVIDVLEKGDIKALCQVKGIKAVKAQKLIQRYNDSKDFSEVYAELGRYGFTSNLVKKLVEYYKSPETVIDVVKTNPYELVNVDGIGFKKADEIAQKIGITGSSPFRVKGAILYLLNQGGMEGRSYLHYTELMSKMYDMIGYVEQETINEVAQKLVEKKEVFVSDDGEMVGILHYRRLECNIAKELMRLSTATETRIKDIDDDTFLNQISQTQVEQGFDFTEEQLSGVTLFRNTNVLAITGGAGCGKTSVAKGMFDQVRQYLVKGCALSGKASVRMVEATGMDASTIHRLLGWDIGSFTYNEKNQLDVDVVFVDECTMINGELFYSLLKAIPNGAKLVLMGDVQQLTPIGSCQVFADILNSNIIPTCKLTKPHRQALRSGIIPTSINVINQQQIFDTTFEGKQILGELQDMELIISKELLDGKPMVVKTFLEQLKLTNDLMETQVIVPLKNRGNLCTYELNIAIQEAINPIRDTKKQTIVMISKDKQYTIQIGDKVINTKNNYNLITPSGDTVAVFNGNMGIVKDFEDGNVLVDFVGIGEVLVGGEAIKGLELAYAVTCHKVQGSGFHTCICALDSSAYVMLNSELLYTMLTRAKKYCILIGKNSAIRTAINKREVNNKQTYLGGLLREYSA